MPQQQQLIDTIEKAIDTLSATTDKVQQAALKDTLNELKKLETDKDGNIIASLVNLRMIAKITKRFESAILSKAYIKGIAEFNEQFRTVSKINENYFSQFDEFKVPKEMSEIEKLTIETTTDNLTERGIKANIVSELKEILIDNIKTGQTFNQINERVKNYIVGTKDTNGKLLSYSKQIATDAINTYSADYNRTISAKLGFVWYRYVGALVKDSRPFCETLVKKEYIHESELGSIAHGTIDGKKVSTAGMIPDTDKSNILTNRGGYNCNHQFMGIPATFVPLSIRNKFEIE